jgi:hypothetical protein
MPRVIAVLSTFTVLLAAGAGAQDDIGCESNPTGDPIGGGERYSEIHGGGDYVVRTAEELLAALAVATEGDVIYVPGDVEINMTGHDHVDIPGGVTLASDRGRDGAPGARIYTTQRATNPLFQTAGDFVRITGLRLEGPFGGRERIAERGSGVMTTHHHLEVDNCEVFAWNWAGIAGQRGATHIYVHHNFIHHCQYAGLGYGVVLDQADARIIANKFDWNRHHIAATGRPGCAYEAAYNLVLTNANSHYFDMHGGRDRGDGTNIAGDWMHVHHNTFLGDGHWGVVIRGVPAQGARIHHNRFATPEDRSIGTGGNAEAYDNVFGEVE